MTRPDTEQNQTGSYNAQASGQSSAAVNVCNNVYNYANAPPQTLDPARREAALRLLAELPTDRLPERGPMPVGSRCAYAPTPYFVGRQDDLKHLARSLKAGGVVAVGQIVAATGLGGIGKSQLAVEFAHRYGRYFAGGVFWLSFAQADSVPGEVARCGGAGAMELGADFDQRPLPEQVQKVQSAWQSDLPRLLIFDNCEEEDLLARWRPPTGNSRVLLTSRRSEWSGELVADCLPLGVLAPAESVELLLKFRPDARSADLHALAAELGHLPLALHLAGSFLQQYRHDAFGQPPAYLAELRQPGLLLRHPSLCVEGQTHATGHARHVARTFALSYERLDADQPQDALALQLLARAAYFAVGEPIPRDLLLGTIPPPETPYAAPDALRRLAQLGLLDSKANGSLVIHRLLGLFVREVCEDAEAALAVESHLWNEANLVNEAGFPAPLTTWRVHLETVAEAAATRGSERAGELFNGLGSYLWGIAAYGAAQAAYERALAIDETVYGLDHPAVAIRINNLGTVLQALGDLPAAQAAYQRAIAISEAAYDPDHPRLALYGSNLGTVLQALGDLPAAQAAYQRALAIGETAYGPNHPQVALCVNNLGYVLRVLNDLPAAQAAFQRALAIDKASYGPEHPSVARDINNLGDVLRDLGDLTAAQAAFEQALAIGKAAYGPDHPQVAIYANNLGNVLQDLGDLPAARVAYERAQAIGEASYGSGHAHVARYINNLGLVLQALGNLPDAQVAFERALVILSRGCGPDHPDTKTVAKNLQRLTQASPAPRLSWWQRLRRWFGLAH
jgi:tetratricopeptide (TPR) repeat protein